MRRVPRINFRHALAATAIVASLGVAACGTTTTGSTPAKSAATAASAQVGYYNMPTLASQIKTIMNQRAAANHLTYSVTSVACFMSGAQTATCDVTGSDGSTTTLTPTISADGSRFQTPGSYTPPSS